MLQPCSQLKTQQKRTPLLPIILQPFTDYKPKSSEIQLNSETNSPLSCNKKWAVSATPETVRDQIVQILEETNTPAARSLLNLLNKWIGKGWKEHRMKISDHINKVKYLVPSLIGESYLAIQKQIMIEWRKNNFLHACQILWNHVFRTEKFQDLISMQKYYNTIRNIIVQVSFMLFKPCLKPLLKKQFPLEHRLYNFTAVSIITASKEWKQLAQKVITPYLYQNAPSFSQNFDIYSIKIPPEVIDLRSQQRLFEETSKSLEKLCQSYSLSELVAGLKQYRLNLLKEIQLNISNWCSKNNQVKHTVLEKDDIISCIIYILVSAKLDKVAVALEYLKFLLGNELDRVLTHYQVDCFRVDLECTVQFLSQPTIHINIEEFQRQQFCSSIISA